MNFRQCLFIAIGIHVAVMGIPIKVKVSSTNQTIVLSITEKPVSSPTMSAPFVKRPPIETPVRPEPEIKIPKPKQRKKNKPKPREKAPEIVKKSVKNIIEPEKVIKEPKRPPAEPIETVPVAAAPVRIVAAKEPELPSRMAPVQFGSAEGPHFLRRVIPGYPQRAKSLHKQGTVILMLTIDTEGNIVDVKIVKKAGFGFDEAAVKALKESTFKAASRNGTSIACRALLPVRFQLR